MSQTEYDQELARIRAEYHRREATPAISQLYRPEHSAVRLHQESIHYAIRKALTRQGTASLADKRLLDIGCGNGSWLRYLVESYGATRDQCVGIDLMEERITS